MPALSYTLAFHSYSEILCIKIWTKHYILYIENISTKDSMLTLFQMRFFFSFICLNRSHSIYPAATCSNHNGHLTSLLFDISLRRYQNAGLPPDSHSKNANAISHPSCEAKSKVNLYSNKEDR